MLATLPVGPSSASGASPHTEDARYPMAADFLNRTGGSSLTMRPVYSFPSGQIAGSGDLHEDAAPATMDISVIVPCFNEEATLRELVARVQGALRPISHRFEVILINDGSNDRTAETLAELAATHPWLKGINLRRNYGQTAALMAGFEHAHGEIILTMDGDLQNDPADFGRLIARLHEGFDVVSGWRINRRDHALSRKLPSLLANKLISCTTGARLHDFGCSLKAYRRDVLEGVHLYGEMHRFIPIYAKWNGARIAEIPVAHHPRERGASNYGLDRTVKVVLDLFLILFLQRYAHKPIYVFGTCGLLSFGVSLLAGLLAVYYKFWGGKTFIETPLPLLWATMFFTGVLCFLLGLVAEIGTRTYHESQGKRTYRIASTVNLGDRDRR